MSDEYHVPEWDCTDDIIDVTEQIGKVVSAILLQEFVHGSDIASLASKRDIQAILRDFAQRNVTAALEFAAKGLLERLETSPDGLIDIHNASRIVRELDYTTDYD